MFRPGPGPNRSFRTTRLGERILPISQPSAGPRSTWPGKGPWIMVRARNTYAGERFAPINMDAMKARLIFPGLGPRRPFMFRATYASTYQFHVTGITKDSSGAVLPNCALALYRTQDDSVVSYTVSDGSGNYSFVCGPGQHYVVAYKVGTPDVAGTTVDTLVGV